MQSQTTIKTTRPLLIKTITRILPFTGLLFLTACGDAEKPNQTNTTSTTLTTNKESIKSVNLDLSSAPLEKQIFLGLITPTAKEAAPCPFLSDTTAVETAKTSWVLKRRETSNERCYWSKNQGFSIKVTVEPLATAKPVQERVYNLESPPVLKDQPEPGNNAVILYDTVWDNERPYAMAFELDNKLVWISVTGMATDAKRLTATAKEVAEKLPTAPKLDQRQNNTDTFSLCSTWSEAEIAAIIGSPVKVLSRGQDCKWEAGSETGIKHVSITIYDGKSYPWESVLEQRGVDIAGVGERGVMERKRKRGDVPGYVLLNVLYNERLVTISTTDTIGDHEAVALALSKNIDSRFN